MSVAGVTQACRTAIVTQIAAEGLTARKYDAWDVSSTSLVTIGLPTWELADQMDQAYGIRSIVFPIYVYQLVDGSAEKSQEYLDINVQTVLNALGQDRTLGNVATSSDVEGAITALYYRDTSMTYVVAEIPLRVYPFPNVGS